MQHEYSQSVFVRQGTGELWSTYRKKMISPRLNYSVNSLRKQNILIFQDCEPLHVNFLPADVQMDNFSELPEVLLHPENFKLAKRFVREWNRYRN